MEPTAKTCGPYPGDLTLTHTRITFDLQDSGKLAGAMGRE